MPLYDLEIYTSILTMTGMSALFVFCCNFYGVVVLCCACARLSAYLRAGKLAVLFLLLNSGTRQQSGRHSAPVIVILVVLQELSGILALLPQGGGDSEQSGTLDSSFKGLNA
jgi:hypothetical protein